MILIGPVSTVIETEDCKLEAAEAFKLLVSADSFLFLSLVLLRGAKEFLGFGSGAFASIVGGLNSSFVEPLPQTF